MPTTVEFPEDKVYNDCKTFINLDHHGHIPITFMDMKTGDDLVMVYLGKEEIQLIAKLYLENHEFIDNEGKVEKDESPDAKGATPQPTTP